MTAHIELWKVASDGTIAAVPQPTNALDSGAAYVLLGNQDPRRVFAWIGSSATQAAKEGAQRHAAELVEAFPSIAASLLHMEGGESEAFRAALETLPDGEGEQPDEGGPHAVDLGLVNDVEPLHVSKSSKKREKKKKKQGATGGGPAPATPAHASLSDRLDAAATDAGPEGRHEEEKEEAAQPSANPAAEKRVEEPSLASGAPAEVSKAADAASSPSAKSPPREAPGGAPKAAPKEAEVPLPESTVPVSETTEPSDSALPCDPAVVPEPESVPSPEAPVLEGQRPGSKVEEPESVPVPTPKVPEVQSSKPEEQSSKPEVQSGKPAAPLQEHKSNTPKAAPASKKNSLLQRWREATTVSSTPVAKLGPAADSAKAWDSSIAVAARIAVTLAPGEQVFPVEELKGLRAESGIDMTRKEDYLSPADFEKVFGKTREEFKAQPAWRQTLAKKQVGLW
ncbi:hypothetical protein ACKKBF_B19315 [Auxenochlorella protothecoides x Auxenochlorella symbiontica]